MIAPVKRKRQPGRAGAGKTALVNDYTSDSTANSAAVQRGQVLAKILADIPANTAAAQRARLIAAMRINGSVTSREGARVLDCYDPRARIHELRKVGWQIKTVMCAERTEAGLMRRVGVYILKGGAP